MRKRRRIFFVFRIISLFFLGLVVALVVAVSKTNVETIRRGVITGLETAVGAPVVVQGDVKWQMALRPRVVLEDVKIENANWANECGRGKPLPYGTYAWRRGYKDAAQL